MPIDLDTLNTAQREAVECISGPLLVLAGAGSGKTRVLTYRIAHILDTTPTQPWEILAITFTNKAAAEMRERLGSLVGMRARGMWVSTFHSMCVRMIRANAQLLGFNENFTIYDDSDSKRLVTSIMVEQDIDPKRFPVNAIRNRISQAKNELIVAADFADRAVDPIGKQAARVYVRLQERLKAANAFDFDDLLLYAYLLLKHHPEVLEAYQKRFRYILVDEYQDTNHAQYEICRLLAAAHRNIMVVGDDDQSIYSWRGADVRNILEFENDYPECSVIKLEQNYRSVGNILDAANAVIANNANRKDKRLFTAGEAGQKIQVYLASDERDEGRWIAGQIERQHRCGISYDDIAVFYRTNAQSRMLEDMLLRAGVPYRIVGGTRFFERKEIKDVMAYLTLAINPADDIAALRVINVPRRSIGKTTTEYLERKALSLDVPFMTAAELAITDDSLRSQTRASIASFVQIIKDASTYEGDLRKVIEMIINKAGLIDALRDEASDEALGKIENIQEFLGVVDEFKATHEENDENTDEEMFFEAPTAESSEEDRPARVLHGDSLADFIEWVRLRTDLDAALDGGQAVTLMTVHSSKGLEFDCVFVAGMEESIFPHMNSIGDAQGVEEERRLAYVAITRARKSLYLTCATQRQLFGSTHVNPISRFLTEIPEELRETSGLGSSGLSGTGWEKRGSRHGISGSGFERGAGRVTDTSSAFGSGERSRNSLTGLSMPQKKSGAMESFVKGDLVDHKTFGRGKVIAVDGDTIQVHFTNLNKTKKLLKDFAPIVKIKQ